jgi:cytidine deaminase
MTALPRSSVTFEQLTAEQRQLVQHAVDVAPRAYAPYSRFRVGAAVRSSQGVFVGTNVENASYGLTQCAERSALSSGIAAGNRAFTQMAIVCLDSPADAPWSSRMPCGACRQWLQELMPAGTVLIVRLTETHQPQRFELPESCEVAIVTVAELLPWGFQFAEAR